MRDTNSPKDVFDSLGRIKKVFLYSSKLIYIPAVIYSIFLPLKLGTIWFYVGFPVTVIGLIMGWIVLVNWTNTPHDEPITKGLYRYSRNPMYVTAFVFFLGLSITTASWVLLLFTIIFLIGCAIFINLEEQLTLEEYGNSYREYMKRTPRWIGIPKSSKKQ
jgi:protein-S-isoprenylcysteine O-methyltransferase Ste14